MRMEKLMTSSFASILFLACSLQTQEPKAFRDIKGSYERTACRNPTSSGVGPGNLFDDAVSGFSRTASLSGEGSSSVKGGVLQRATSNESLTLLYLSCANANLAGRNYSASIDDFNKALAIAGLNDSGAEFLSIFGMIIAYDNLHLPDQCERCFLRMRTLINTFDDEEVCFENFLSPNDEILNWLKTLVDMAPSIEIRGELLSVLSDIFPFSGASLSLDAGRMNGMYERNPTPSEVGKPSYFILSAAGGRPPLAEGETPSQVFNEKSFSAVPCKSFWRRLEKLGHNIYRTCSKVYELIERLLDISDRISGGSNANFHQPEFI